MRPLTAFHFLCRGVPLPKTRPLRQKRCARARSPRGGAPKTRAPPPQPRHLSPAPPRPPQAGDHSGIINHILSQPEYRGEDKKHLGALLATLVEDDGFAKEAEGKPEAALQTLYRDRLMSHLNGTLVISDWQQPSKLVGKKRADAAAAATAAAAAAPVKQPAAQAALPLRPAGGSGGGGGGAPGSARGGATR